jgi:transmembrane sensor
MRYLTYDVHDYAADESFVRWVVDKDPEATRFWEVFIAEHPRTLDKIEAARALVLNLQRAQKAIADDDGVRRVWDRIEAQTSPELKPWYSTRTTMRIAAAIAVIAVVSAGAWFVIGRSNTNSNSLVNVIEEIDFVEKVNTTGHPEEIRLGDGSLVSLENNSRLRYKESFAGLPVREVYLKGEAFFEIARNVQQPFLVHTNEVVTKVLGTSFRIKAYDDDQDILVSVREGKVSVYAAEKVAGKTNKPLNGVVLTPNQQVIYQRHDNSFSKTLVASPQVIVEEKKTYNFNFENASAKSVFDTLEEAYGVEIIYNDETINDCYLTAPMGNEPLYDKLKIICRTIDVTYELIDAKIVISGKGCSKADTEP